MELKQGTLLHGGTYKIERVLGQGSFGITYLAIHTALNKSVAIKEFFMKELNGRGEDGSITGMSDGSLSMNYARKFQKEALNLSRLEHPNIVRVTDSFEDNGTFYYVMDYIEGENLNDYVKHHYVSQQEAVDIIRDVAKALMYMHEEKHMLHLDLKPGNIMRRSSDGHIFLIDFGLSKHYSTNGQPETSTTIGLGTAGYAPIEQANQAKYGEFRPTIDVYALGATFYKLLTGETPPAASELVSDDELLANSLKKFHVDSMVSYAIIHSMLPNVRKRIQTVKAFLAVLPRKVGVSNIASNNTVAGEETIIAGTSTAPKSEETVIDNTAIKEKYTTKKSEISSTSNDTSDVASNEPSNTGRNCLIGCMFVTLIFLGVIIVCFRGCGQTPQPGITSADSDTVAIDTAVADTSAYYPETSYTENHAITFFGETVTYTGDFLPDKGSFYPCGNGKMVFSDGRVYEGLFNRGMMEGDNATFTYPNGDTYKGSFKENHFSYGTYTVRQTGEYFVGHFNAKGQPKSGKWYDKNGGFIEKI